MIEYNLTLKWASFVNVNGKFIDSTVTKFIQYNTEIYFYDQNIFLLKNT